MSNRTARRQRRGQSAPLSDPLAVLAYRMALDNADDREFVAMLDELAASVPEDMAAMTLREASMRIKRLHPREV